MDDHSIQKIALETATSLVAAEHSQPFGFGVDVYKVLDKIFMMTMIYQGEKIITVKCSPQDAEMLRDIYPSIRPGYHMNKKHWITIYPGQEITMELVKDLVIASYELVISKLPKHQKIGLEAIK
ncbi:MmcQ/YjbR family DNA-binding protein [Acinetobacter terrae]|uniref:MmcQ/YjbR family DNA-binding protein n=1 Tax=Acinetobacter terrae TaxID=2731247 RepID=A0A4R0EIQ3_9GAMM|nr:MmcQ/YjbR family DNA-binding protein [Acinetobacter terrae]NNH40091.1 MmcQ/YjbR family DNA-binding protein [Acinetobacter terrae]TCB56664.1 MmcQ/YjbR family DNA-binding protein [Acinetobacter terrae]